jgi:acetyl esterase
VIGSPTQEVPSSLGFSKAGAIVFNVDYRLFVAITLFFLLGLTLGYSAPEHRFPAAADDAIASFDWVLENADSLGVDTSRILVYGSSAGANLAAVVAQHARNKGVKLAGHLLRIPYLVVNSAFPKDLPNESYSKFTETPILAKSHMEKFYNTYTEGTNVDPKDPKISPLLQDLKGLSPAYLEIAGRDRALRDFLSGGD